MSENEAWLGTSPEEHFSGNPDEAVPKSNGRSGTGHADAGTGRIAARLETAASAMRDRAAEAGGVRERVGNVAADRVEKTSEYFRERDTREVVGDVGDYVRHHPVQAAAGALVVGYMLGRLRS